MKGSALRVALKVRRIGQEGVNNFWHIPRLMGWTTVKASTAKASTAISSTAKACEN